MPLPDDARTNARTHFHPPQPPFASAREQADAGVMMKFRAALLVLAATLTFGFVQAHAQTPQQPRPTSTPYAGDLSIFEYPDRDQKLQPQKIMDLLHVHPGGTFADLGAGSGWFTVRAARRVGPKGTVFAEDINPKAIEYIDSRAAKENLHNIKTVLGTPDDAKLPLHAVDTVLLLKVYHEIARSIPFMQSLRASLAPHARVAIVDRNGSGTDHGLNQAIVEREMAEAGYRKVGFYDFTKADGQDYFLIFEAR
jgi:SAM-dependent methyltransferase